MSTVIIIDCHCQTCSVQPREAESCSHRRATVSLSQHLNQERKRKREEAAILRGKQLFECYTHQPEQNQRIGGGKLNKPLFIEELNAAEYFSVSGEVVEYLPMKSTQQTHAKMKRTVVSL